MFLTKFRDVALPTYQGETDLALTFAGEEVELRQGAVDPSGDGPAVKAVRIPHRCVLVGDEEGTIEDKWRALNRTWSRGRGWLVRQGYDGVTYRTQAKIVSLQRSSPQGSLGMVPCIITFQLLWPVWMLEADEPWAFDTGHVFDEPGLIFDGHADQIVMTASGDQIVIDNNGSLLATRAIFFFRPQPGGSIADPRVTNQTNGMWFQYSGTLEAGDVLYVDWMWGVARLNGQDVWTDITLGEEQVDVMQLELDQNTLEITCTAIGGGVEAICRWSRHSL